MLRVIWAPKAQQNYNDILDDLAQVSVDAALTLDAKVDKLMFQLSRFPFLCPPSNFKTVYRRCVVSKNYSVVYRVRNETVYVTSVENNRSNS